MNENRDKVIVRTSVIGIITNVLLVIFKMIVGFAANSIAVILDAINNLSDALSSIITIVGTKLANRRPDKKHPLGHGRIEYMTSMIVAGLVLYAGITAFIESVKKIIHPEVASYTNTSLIIIAVAVVVKMLLGRYVKKQGEKVNSGALVASGSDAMFDAILSFSVLISAIIFVISNISLEAYVGVVISIYIIKSGIGMFMDAVSEILGKRADKELVNEVRKVIVENEAVKGAYDLFMYNYGPDKNYGSVHIELPDTMNIDELDVLTRKIESDVYHKTGVIMTGIGVYSYNTKNDEINKIRSEIQRKVFENDFVMQLHGFYADLANKKVRFDVVLSFDVIPDEGIKKIKNDLEKLYPDYEFNIVPDIDISD